MCGVSGFIDFNNCVVDPVNKIFDLTVGIKKRGPDGHGVFVDQQKGIFVSHTILSIFGSQQASLQPMISDCQRFVISYNGEIYNTSELIKLFDRKANDYLTSDTKIILELWAKIDTKCINLLEGIFAFFIWDRQEQKAYLVKDHLGIKPLYYFYDAETKFIAFSSSAKNIALSFGLSMEEGYYDPVLGCCIDDKTIYENVLNLEAGHFLEFSKNGIQLVRWHNPADYTNDSTIPAKKESLEDLFLEIVSSQLPKEKFGIFLSDGVDSTLIACFAKLLKREFCTFTIGVENGVRKVRNESVQAKKTADFLKSDHHEFILTQKNRAALMAEFLQAKDLPSTDGFNVFLAAKLAKDFCRVVFSGLGADELFFGYNYFYSLQNYLKLSTYPRLARTFIFKAGKIFSKLPKGLSFLHRLNLDFLGKKELESLWEKYIFYRSCDRKIRFQNSAFFDLNFKDDFVTNFLASVGTQLSDWQKIIFWELYTYDQYKLLRDGDSFTSHFGLEMRVPFLDKRLINYALRQAPKLGKPDLLNLLLKIYPEYKILQKQGFELF